MKCQKGAGTKMHKVLAVYVGQVMLDKINYTNMLFLKHINIDLPKKKIFFNWWKFLFCIIKFV